MAKLRGAPTLSANVTVGGKPRVFDRGSLAELDAFLARVDAKKATHVEFRLSATNRHGEARLMERNVDAEHAAAALSDARAWIAETSAAED